MRLYTCVCVCANMFVHRLWVLVSVFQRVDSVMHAYVFSCAYVCGYVCVWVYIYLHFFAVSVTCTLQVFQALVHRQVCMLHRCVFTPNVHICEHTRCSLCTYVHMYICVYMHAYAYGCVCVSMI